MKDVLGDALLSLRLLKVGGVMIFDDYFMDDVARAAAAYEEAAGNFLQVLYKEKVRSPSGCTLEFLRGCTVPPSGSVVSNVRSCSTLETSIRFVSLMFTL